jgi:hypothetical protein
VNEKVGRLEDQFTGFFVASYKVVNTSKFCADIGLNAGLMLRTVVSH